jgi:hypothetical protein
MKHHRFHKGIESRFPQNAIGKLPAQDPRQPVQLKGTIKRRP